MANAGKEFEKQFKDSVPKDVYILRIPDSALGFNIEASTQRFSVKTPYDFVAFKKPNMFALELKSTSTTSISFKGKTPMIKEHQIKALRHAESKGVKAGFVFNFRKSNNTYYVPISVFDAITLQGMTTKSSISEKEVSTHEGVVHIEQVIKRTTYSFRLEELFDIAVLASRTKYVKIREDE